MTLAAAIAVPLAGFWALVCWRVRLERGWVGLTEFDRRVLRLRLAILRMEEAVARAMLPAMRRLMDAFARARPIFDALNERMLADPDDYE